jgi:hypothetical protein
MSSTLLSSKYGTPTGKAQAQYSRRNRIAPSFHGACFVVEDVWVPCGHCAAPVDPVVRVPVGALYFHPHCLRCTLCGAPHGKHATFASVNGQPLCRECQSHGYKPKKLQHSKYAASSGPAVMAPGVGSPVRMPQIEGSPARAGPSPRVQALLDRQAAVARHDENIMLLAPIAERYSQPGGMQMTPAGQRMGRPSASARPRLIAATPTIRLSR